MNFIKKLSVLLSYFTLILYALTPAFASTDPYPKNPNIDIINYTFDLELSDTTDMIRAKASLTFLTNKEGIDKLRLDLVDKKALLEGKGMVVRSVESNGKSLPYSHESNVLWVQLPSSGVDQEQTITIVYEGIPNDGLKIAPNKYGDRTFFSDNWPDKAKNWLPVVDHPYDKATCAFKVTAPAHYQVVSNGLKIEESDLGNHMRMTHWKQSVPIACWLYVLGVAEFAVQYVDTFDNKSIQTWVYKQDREAGFYDFAVPTKDVLQFYSDYVGPFAYEKLANIQSNSVGGGMEAASAILYGDNAVVGDRNEGWRNVVIHEIAHQWFGNAVTEYDWDDVWLSEGLTTYFTLRYIKHAYGYDAFVDGLEDARKEVIKLSDNKEDYTIVHDNLQDMAQVTSGLTYQKGAWITHMICNFIGEEAFHQGIRAYYKQYFNGNATTTDLRLALEKASGKDLKPFFEQWLYQGGYPKLKGTWHYDTKNKNIVVELKQVQDEKYNFKMPLEIGITDANDIQHIQTITLDQRTIKISFPSAEVPKILTLDPETKLLAEWDFQERNN